MCIYYNNYACLFPPPTPPTHLLIHIHLQYPRHLCPDSPRVPSNKSTVQCVESEGWSWGAISETCFWAPGHTGHPSHCLHSNTETSGGSQPTAPRGEGQWCYLAGVDQWWCLERNGSQRTRPKHWCDVVDKFISSWCHMLKSHSDILRLVNKSINGVSQLVNRRI